MNKRNKIIMSIFVIVILILISITIALNKNCIKHEESPLEVIEYNFSYYEKIPLDTIKDYELKDDARTDILYIGENYKIYSSTTVNNLSVIIINSSDNYFYYIVCNYLVEKEISDALNCYAINSANDINKIIIDNKEYDNQSFINSFYDKLTKSKVSNEIDLNKLHLDSEIKITNNTSVPLKITKFDYENLEIIECLGNYYIL